MSTWTYTHALVADVPAEAVWAHLIDVEQWPRWDADVEWARLDGDLRTGATGHLKPVGGTRTRLTITHLEPGRRLTDVSHLPLATVAFDHRVTATGIGCRLAHTITITGLTTPLFAKLVGTRAARGLPESMSRLVALAGS